MSKKSEKKEIVPEVVVPEETEALEETVPHEELVSVENADSDAAAPVEDDKRVTVVMPKYLFSVDAETEHHEVCYKGRIYQVQYDTPVRVPAPVADIINNAIAQAKKVIALLKGLDGKSTESKND